MPTMRMSILNVDESTVTPLKFRGWLRAETIDIQRTARNKDDIIVIRLFMTIAMMACLGRIVAIGSPKTLAADAMKKDIFRVEETDDFGLIRTRPTNGSDRGFARSNLNR